MKRYTISIGGETYNIGLQELAPDRYRVLASGKVYELKVMLEEEESDLEIPGGEFVERQREKKALEHKQPELLPKVAKTAPPETPSPKEMEKLPETLHAPMPGVILEVNARPGMQVTRGDQLFVLEAMKMKNPIRSPRDGVVEAVFVETGQSVQFDDLLLRFGQG